MCPCTLVTAAASQTHAFPNMPGNPIYGEATQSQLRVLQLCQVIRLHCMSVKQISGRRVGAVVPLGSCSVLPQTLAPDSQSSFHELHMIRGSFTRSEQVAKRAKNLSRTALSSHIYALKTVACHNARLQLGHQTVTRATALARIWKADGTSQCH